jgi:hypothetical protein
MKNLLKWIKGLFSRKPVSQDTRKENLYRVLWRTKDTGWYANEARVWAACEEDIPDILRKFYKMKKNEKFTEFRVLQKIRPL